MHRPRSSAPGTAFTVTLTIALVGLAGCTSSSTTRSTGSPGTVARSITSSSITTGTITATTAATSTTSTSITSTSTTWVPLPAGPVADLSEELTGGTAFIGSAQPTALEGTGYVQHEYVAAGTATSYRPGGPLSPDGHWTFTPDGSATTARASWFGDPSPRQTSAARS